MEIPSSNPDGDGDETLIQKLPEDVLLHTSLYLCPKDLCRMAMACKKFNAVFSSDKFWLPQCKASLGSSSNRRGGPVDLVSWRAEMLSYKAICRFIRSVRSLLGIWVHQNPELGNLVYSRWGFISVLGCRVIPQEVGPRGLEPGYGTGLQWAPVFEVVGQPDGSPTFFLHGRERDRDFCYPGHFAGASDDCNVLSLEAEPRRGSGTSSSRAVVPAELDNGESSSSSSFSSFDLSSSSLSTSFLLEEELAQPCPRPGNCKKMVDTPTTSLDSNHDPVPFHRLHFADRKRLLEGIAHKIRSRPPPPISPSSSSAAPRHALMLLTYQTGDASGRKPCSGSHFDGVKSELLEKLCNLENHPVVPSSFPPKQTTAGSSLSLSMLSAPIASPRKLSLAKIIREKMKQIIGMGPAAGGGTHDHHLGSKQGLNNKGISAASKQALLRQFLKQGDTVALRLHARCWKLQRYRTWPLMSDNRYALYKMPEQEPNPGNDLAGIWGATFGWKHAVNDKPRKALYILLLSYDDSESGKLLIATKILEGTHHVLHPNGSPMFTAKVDEFSPVPFPWPSDKDGESVDIVNAFQGEGIANGYGFRYPGSKPGDLYVERKGSMVFVWRESKLALTMQRLNLDAMLEKGERMPPLTPIANFTYLTKSYSNIFTGYGGLVSRARVAAEAPTEAPAK